MTTKPEQHFNRRNVASLIFIILAICLVVPNLASFSKSLATLRDAYFVHVGLGVLFWLSTFLSAALVYKFIALRPLRYTRTSLIQLASGFTNRLAPMGAGIVTLNISYLIKCGHSAIQAGAIVALNNLLGFVGIVILVLGTVLVNPDSAAISTNFGLQLSPRWTILGATGLLAILGFLVVFGLKRMKQVQKAIRVIVQNSLHKPSRLGLALLSSMTITAGYAAALYSICLGFNVHVSIAQILIVLTVGVAVGAITPTPGGIGGAEVGLVAALIAVGVTSHQALTVALTYRFLVYWLPILPGFICFQIALRRRYI